MGFSPSIILAPYDEHWKSMRRLTRHYLSKTACQTFVPSQERDAKLLLRLLLEDPSNYRSAIHQYVSSIDTLVSMIATPFLIRVSASLGKTS